MTNLIARGVLVAGVASIPGGAALAQVPAEVSGLVWCAGPKNCLEWTAVTGATQYRVYRGTDTTLRAVLNGSPDSCLAGVPLSPSLGPFYWPQPAAGRFDWYLVTAENGAGEGSPGSGTAGPRQLDLFGGCAGSPLVLNEVDYDQPGTDSAEFVELKSVSPLAVPLDDIAVVLVNGANVLEYQRFALAGPLPAGAYAVLRSTSVSVPPTALSFVFPGPSVVQNGAPDGIALFDVAQNVLLDALSYEGSITNCTILGAPGVWNLVEGNATAASDDGTGNGSLIRFPDATDTNDAASDWRSTSSLTPGSANVWP